MNDHVQIVGSYLSRDVRKVLVVVTDRVNFLQRCATGLVLASAVALPLAGTAHAQDERRIEVPSVSRGDVVGDVHRSEREASRKIGELLYRRGQFAQASTELEAAVSADPHDARALL